MSRPSAIFPMNSPLEAYDVLVRPIVVGFPFFGHGKKERKGSSKSSSSDQTTGSTSCKQSPGKGIRYYLDRATLFQGAAAGAVAQRVSIIMDKVTHVSGCCNASTNTPLVMCGIFCEICIMDGEGKEEVFSACLYFGPTNFKIV